MHPGYSGGQEVAVESHGGSGVGGSWCGTQEDEWGEPGGVNVCPSGVAV